MRDFEQYFVSIFIGNKRWDVETLHNISSNNINKKFELKNTVPFEYE